MSHAREAIAVVERAVRSLGGGRWLLAVSGGVDSAVLLDAAARVLPRDGLIAATFHHGTGEWAERATAHTVRLAAERSVPCVVGRAHARLAPTETAWREARWEFLRDAAIRSGATIVTAHTEDDQVETVALRILRGSGARGLAGLYAASGVRRPLVHVPRAAISAYAAVRCVPFVEDPANADRRHARVRLRLDILPALERAAPGFRRDLLGIAARAATWRERMERIALSFPTMYLEPGTRTKIAYRRSDLRSLPETSLRALWPALAARAGVVMDRRGTARLASFTIEGETGQVIQLAGGTDVRMEREAILLTRKGRTAAPRG